MASSSTTSSACTYIRCTHICDNNSLCKPIEAPTTKNMCMKHLKISMVFASHLEVKLKSGIVTTLVHPSAIVLHVKQHSSTGKKITHGIFMDKLIGES